MKLFIIILAMSIVGLIMCFCLYMALEKIKSLEDAKQNLKNDNSKLSDALRRKGIEVGQLEKKVRRLEKK